MIGAIIQARMNSSRLPGKVVAPIEGLPLLAHVVARARRAATLQRVIVATTTGAMDDGVADIAAQAGAAVVRGSEHDVLDRYYQAARQHGLDVIVRITADCPLFDPDVCDAVVRCFEAQVPPADYVSNALEPTFPDGLDTEVVSFAALATAWREAREAHQREHVMPYLYEHPQRFRIVSYKGAADYSSMRWIVDEEPDLQFVRAVYQRLSPVHPAFGWRDVLALLEREPSLQQINGGLRRNAGFLDSLKQQQVFQDWPSYVTWTQREMTV